MPPGGAAQHGLHEAGMVTAHSGDDRPLPLGIHVGIPELPHDLTIRAHLEGMPAVGFGNQGVPILEALVAAATGSEEVLPLGSSVFTMVT